ncbi:beta-N-acetylhexosaminidase [Ureibacillus terrenus]|uniref:beta-N-acetylhexosaminidase n=1 Tax=Ureibacillus terrenus TaxID=118246 RepID=UPI002E235AE6|nr:beta-N-acetylhexosaminidase [Ureibacillus terrenus]
MKKGIFVGFIILVVVAAIFMIIATNRHSEAPTDENYSKEPSPPNTEISASELIGQIIQNANEGKVLHSPIIAGHTRFEEVKNIFGLPDKIEETVVGDYVYYPAFQLSLGLDGQLVFDVRSYDERLSLIHLQDIQKELGEPEQTTYFEDETVSQIILYYRVNDDYFIKWILEKPTADVPNPKVHHISVIMADNPSKYANLVARMSLEEKIGQMVFAGFSGQKPNKYLRQLIIQKKIGGVIFLKENLKSVPQMTSLINEIKKLNSNNPYPLFLGIDQEGGSINRLPDEVAGLPTNDKLGLKNNPAFAFDYGKLLGKQLNAFGFNIDFAPVLDVNSNPENPVIGRRAISNNPEIVSNLGIQMMKGIQSENIIPVIKHFPGHGDTSTDSHLALPVVNKTMAELEQMELLPFKNAILEGADAVMVAHILLPKLDAHFPASMSKTIITDVLREKLKFNGIVITDDMMMKAITDHYSIEKAALFSVKAGSDIILIAHHEEKISSVIDQLISAVERGEISEQHIDKSVVRILRLKEKYQLDHSSVEFANIEKLNKEIHTILYKYN